jgi:hypothetical protein
MKTRFILLVLLIVCISCGTNNKPVSDAQKEKIKGEVKEVVNTFIKGCEEVNFDKAIEPFLDSPDFVDLVNGKTLSYKELMAMKPNFNTLLNQKCTIVDEKYAFLDKSTVLYTADSKWSSNYKDGRSSISDPEVFMFIFKKIDSRWKIVSYADSFVEKNVPSETSKELNQVELMKQFLGNWKAEFGKDTIAYFDQKAYGVGQEVFIKGTSKGKMISEGKQLWGYDKKLDKIVNAYELKGQDLGIVAFWFISKNKYVGVPYSDISNPQEASTKWEGEFKSPDTYVETHIVNNKPVRTDTYTRIK